MYVLVLQGIQICKNTCIDLLHNSVFLILAGFIQSIDDSMNVVSGMLLQVVE